jgi:hypothetical protein
VFASERPGVDRDAAIQHRASGSAVGATVVTTRVAATIGRTLAATGSAVGAAIVTTRVAATIGRTLAATGSAVGATVVTTRVAATIGRTLAATGFGRDVVVVKRHDDPFVEKRCTGCVRTAEVTPHPGTETRTSRNGHRGSEQSRRHDRRHGPALSVSWWARRMRAAGPGTR